MLALYNRQLICSLQVSFKHARRLRFFVVRIYACSASRFCFDFAFLCLSVLLSGVLPLILAFNLSRFATVAWKSYSIAHVGLPVPADSSVHHHSLFAVYLPVSQRAIHVFESGFAFFVVSFYFSYSSPPPTPHAATASMSVVPLARAILASEKLFVPVLLAAVLFPRVRLCICPVCYHSTPQHCVLVMLMCFISSLRVCAAISPCLLCAHVCLQLFVFHLFLAWVPNHPPSTSGVVSIYIRAIIRCIPTVLLTFLSSSTRVCCWSSCRLIHFCSMGLFFDCYSLFSAIISRHLSDILWFLLLSYVSLWGRLPSSIEPPFLLTICAPLDGNALTFYFP